MVDIITIFCDKDSHCIDNFLSYVKRLSFGYKLTIIDNRHNKSEDLSSKLAAYNYIACDEDIGLFETRRKAFNMTHEDWVWFVDIDDELWDFKLKCDTHDDVILYNFKLSYNGTATDCGQSTTNRLYRINGTDDEIGYISAFFSYNGVWNKVFNRKTLAEVYKKVPTMKNLFLYEDLLLMKYFIYTAKRFRTDTQVIYQWNAHDTYPLNEHIDHIKSLIPTITEPRLKKFLEDKWKDKKQAQHSFEISFLKKMDTSIAEPESF